MTTTPLCETRLISVHQPSLFHIEIDEKTQRHQQRLLKIKRIHQGGAIRVLDLFSGCGGLSLGFDAAGFEIIGAVEFDSTAAYSHALNFHRSPDGKPETIHAQDRDITKTEPEDLLKELYPNSSACESVDVLIGGPPCQAFARVGRAKLREVAAHPDAFKLDDRGNLYLRYLTYVRHLNPIAILIENVPDVINYGGHNIPQEICEVLSDLGYRCAYTLLNAAFYGVPQMRERMFLLAYARELEVSIEFPEPTHWIDLPRGYAGSRQVALKAVNLNMLNPDNTVFFQPPPIATPDLKPAITVQEAIGDLPPITLHLEGTLRRGARRFDKLTPYRDDVEVSEYAWAMRNWPKFESRTGIYDHVIRSLPRDYALFRRMNPGDQYPQAYAHAVNMFHERLAELASAGILLESESSRYKELWKELVPPYDTSKFPNKWRKMEANKPARTLMAHLGKDGYSHIHYDSNQARTISVREAARLQSFPDGFQFFGTMNPAFRQIGNAVPPILSHAIAQVILKNIQGRLL